MAATLEYSTYLDDVWVDRNWSYIQINMKNIYNLYYHVYNKYIMARGEVHKCTNKWDN